MAPIKRSYDSVSTADFNRPSKIMKMSAFLRNGRTYNPAMKRGYNNVFRQSGPYRNLTYGDRHQNPVYPTPEVKYSDLGQDGNGFLTSPLVSPITAAGSVSCLNQINAGTGVNQRIGTQVTIRNVSYRFEVDLPTTVANQVPTSGRVILLWDKQSNGALPIYLNIFNVANYLSFMNPSAAQRFTILRNQQFSLSPNGDQTLFFEGFCRINMKCTYNSSGGSIPNSGALLLVFIADQTAAINQPTLSGCWRVRYLDN